MMTSKIKIDIAKIKEERKQYATKMEQYKAAKAKPKKVASVIKFDDLKKFHALEKFVSEPSIPVEEYGDPIGNFILDADEYQSICNATCAYKKTIQRKGQANIKISNVLKYSDYSKEEKHEIGLNILFLMSVHPEYRSDCAHILDQWLFEWQPTFLEVCIILENFGCNVRKILGKQYIPNCYEVALIKAKVDYEEFNTKASNKYLELNTDCLKSVLVYLKSIIEYFNQDELQSLLVLLSALSLDVHCIEFKIIFNELVNKCLVCLENANIDNLLNILYLMMEKSIDQCYFVNKILNPCNSVNALFTVQISYLFMCNLLLNYNLVALDNSIRNLSNVSSNSSQLQTCHQRDTRSKRKLVESKKQIEETHVSPKTQQGNLLKKENTKLNNVKAVAKPLAKGKQKSNTNIDKAQKSILDYWKVREKSPDLNVINVKSPDLNATNVLAKVPNSNAGSNVRKKANLKREESNKESKTKLVEFTNQYQRNKELKIPSDETTEDCQSESDEILPSNTPCDQLRSLIFSKHKSDTVTFLKLYKLVRQNLQHHLECPLRIYRIINLLNCIVNLLHVDESNMDACKLLMQELSQIQHMYYGLHDMHRHLVCVYLQQYTTVWGTFVNRIQHQIDQRNEDYAHSDSS